MIVSHYLAGKKVSAPENSKELAIELNYDKEDIPKEQVSVNKWRWIGENAATINKHVSDGILGGVGVTEGIPHKIEIEHYGVKNVLINGYLDTMEETDYSCNEVTLSTKEKKGIDWLNDNADGFTFEYLESLGTYNFKDRYVMIPYVLSPLPNGREILMCSLTIFVVTQELKRELTYYQEQIPKFANPFTVSELISTAIHVIYTIALVVTLVKMITDLVKYIIQPVKYHAGMYVKDLFEIGCQKMGYTFKSTILQSAPFNRMVLIPEKNKQFELDGILGYQTPNKNVQKGYYKGTFGDFVRSFKEMFNAKIILDGNVFNFERVDFNTSKAKYKIPDLRNDFFSFNTSEFSANYLVEFATDINDKNTIQNYQGTAVVITTTPKKVINADMVLAKKIKTVSIPFARTTKKTQLTIPEVICDGFLEVFDVIMNSLINVLNGIINTYNTIVEAFQDILDALDFIGINIDLNFQPIQSIKKVSFGTLIDDRKGMMLLENEFIVVPKLAIVNENKTNNRKTDIDELNSVYLSAEYIYSNFHFVNNFVEVNGKHNQWIKYKLSKVPFNFDDYQKVKRDNIITDKFNNFARIDSLRWFVEKGYADISYRVNKIYINNLKNVITQNDGN